MRGASYAQSYRLWMTYINGMLYAQFYMAFNGLCAHLRHAARSAMHHITLEAMLNISLC